jgi:hypothetical protein
MTLNSLWLINEFGLADLNEIDLETVNYESALQCLNSNIRADIMLNRLKHWEGINEAHKFMIDLHGQEFADRWIEAYMKVVKIDAFT